MRECIYLPYITPSVPQTGWYLVRHIIMHGPSGMAAEVLFKLLNSSNDKDIINFISMFKDIISVND